MNSQQFSPKIKIGMSFGTGKKANPGKEDVERNSVRFGADPVENSRPYTTDWEMLDERSEVTLASKVKGFDFPALGPGKGKKGLSLNRNPGDTFTMVYPTILPGTEEEAEIEAIEEGGNKTTVLLVDDESFVIRVAEQVLRRNGFSVLAADNGREAVSRFEENPEIIKLVITDLAMPVMDGRATFRAIRKINPHIPIIVCSGFLPDLGMFASEVGSEPDGFVQKPYEIGTMLKTVTDALDRGKGR